jgi:hypothetical protein
MRECLWLFNSGYLPKYAFDALEGFEVDGDAGVHRDTVGGVCKNVLQWVGARGDSMNALERLHAARTLVSEGRHEEALHEYIWFFERACEENRSLAALRLSGALADWVALAEVYPKARHALESIRDRKAQLLLFRLLGWNAFHDIVSINEYLGCTGQTYFLFKALAASDEKFAKRCADIALPSILQAGDYELAERFLGDPAQLVLFHSEILNRTSTKGDQAKYPDEPYLESHIDFYVQQIKQIEAVLEGRGRLDEARQLHDLAVQAVQEHAIREAVIEALKPGALRWYEMDDDEASA